MSHQKGRDQKSKFEDEWVEVIWDALTVEEVWLGTTM